MYFMQVLTIQIYLILILIICFHYIMRGFSQLFYIINYFPILTIFQTSFLLTPNNTFSLQLFIIDNQSFNCYITIQWLVFYLILFIETLLLVRSTWRSIGMAIRVASVIGFSVCLSVLFFFSNPIWYIFSKSTAV